MSTSAPRRQFNLESQAILQKACRAAIDLLGADRSTFVRFAADYSYGEVCAEDFSDNLSRFRKLYSVLNKRTRIAGIPEQEPLLNGNGIVKYNDVERDIASGIFKRSLVEIGVKSVLIVRVQWQKSILGSFSIDCTEQKRSFTERDIQIATLLADMIAQALGNAQTNARERHRVDLLSRLDETRTLLKSAANEVELRERVLRAALALSGWSAGALFRFSENRGELELQVIQRSRELEERNMPLPSELTVPRSSSSWLWEQLVSRDEEKPRVLVRTEQPDLFKCDPLLRPFERALVLPITPFDKLDSALLLLDDAPDRPWQQDEIELLLEFSTRATAAIQRQEWWEEAGQRLLEYFSLLFSLTPRSETDLDRMLYRFLTMVTAGFGLKFNRATVFLLNDAGDLLVPRFAIGQFDHEEWRSHCKADQQSGQDQFKNWFEVPFETHRPTEMELWARDEPAFSLEDPENEVLHEALASNYLLLSEPDELTRLPRRLRQKLAPSSPVVLARLHDGQERIGLVIADKEWTERLIGMKDLHYLQMFCKETAHVIGSYRQQQRIPEINKASALNDIKTDPNFANLQELEVVQGIVLAVKKGFGNAAVGALYIDQIGVAQSDLADIPAWIEDTGILDMKGPGERAMRRRMVEVLEEEQLAAAFYEHGVYAVTFLPLSRDNRGIGFILALHNQRLATKHLDDSTLERYAREASEVYNSWLQVHFLRNLQSAMQDITRQISRGDAARQMVIAAKSLFRAGTATFWPYDSRSGEFMSPPEQEGFRDRLPNPSGQGLTFRIVREIGYYPVGDVHRVRDELHPKTFEFLEKYEQRSIQGIAIGQPGERLGVLYLTYSEPRNFTFGAKVQLEEFARNAAVVLESARAADSSRHVLESAEEVGRVLAMGNKEQALNSVAARTRSSVRCHSVTIFSLNRAGEPEFPPVLAGADKRSIEREDREDSIILVRRLIDERKPTVATTAEEVRRLFKSKFADREQVEATIAIPLQFTNVYVGLMFVSFRRPLPAYEVDPVLALASLFAYQAAVAIGNASRFRDLGKLSDDFLKEGESQGVFNIALDFIMRELQPNQCAVMLRENAQFRVIAHRGWPPELFQEIVETDSHAGFTYRLKEPNRFQSLEDASRDRAFAGFHPPERLLKAGVVSGAGIPIFSPTDVCGALVLHTSVRRLFSDEDISYLSLIANEMMAASRSVSMLRSMRAQYEIAKVAAEYDGDIVSASNVLERILQICRDALVDGANQPKVAAAELALFDPSVRGVTLGEPGPAELSAAVEEHLYDGRHHVGQLSIWTHGRRAFDEDDRHLLNNVYALIKMFARQVREQARVLSNLSVETHEYEGCQESLRYVNLLLNGMGGELTADQRVGFSNIRNALLRYDDAQSRMRYTVKVITGNLSPLLNTVAVSAIHTLLLKSADRFFDAAFQKNVTIVLPSEPTDSNIMLDLDEKLLLTVFNNILGNALKFAPAGSSIICALGSTQDKVRIGIADQGPGVSKAEHFRIFEPWHQAEEHKHLQLKGFGVGLFISQKIARLHGGSIEVRSPSTSGCGSCFEIELPIRR